MKSEQDWIDGILHSIDGINRAQPDDALYHKVERAIFSTETVRLNSNTLPWIGIAAALLLMLNLFTVKQFTKNNQEIMRYDAPHLNQGSELLMDYQLYPE